MNDELFCIDFMVRDYECDMQGVVNNAVYQNYLEHARHEYLKELGLDFAELSRRRINLVVVRAELDYKRSLQAGDHFQIKVRMERVSPLRIAFLQDIHRHSGGELILKARIVGTVLNPKGRPQIPDEISAVVKEVAPEQSPKNASIGA